MHVNYNNHEKQSFWCSYTYTATTTRKNPQKKLYPPIHKHATRILFFVNNSKNKIKFYLISTTINYFLKCCFFLVLFIHVPFLWLSYLSFEEILCVQGYMYQHRVVKEIIVTLLLVFADDFIAFSQPDVVVDVFIFRVRVSSWLNFYWNFCRH